MVLLQASKYLNRWLGPVLLKNGVRLRQSLLSNHQYRDTPSWDAVLGISVGQWLTALEAHEHANDVIRAELLQQRNDKADFSRSLTLDEEGNLRVQVLEKHYLKPDLLSTDGWHASPRLVRWMRREYLLARFGPHVRATRTAYPQLAEAATSSSPPTWAQLPTSNLVQATLCSTVAVSSSSPRGGKNKDNHVQAPTWAAVKNRPKVLASMQSVVRRYGGTMELVHGGNLCADVHWPQSNESRVVPKSLADALQIYGANVYSAAPLNAWLEYPHSALSKNSFLLRKQQQSFTLWTREYISHLGDYLCRRADEYSKTTSSTTVLEVGAGDGVLTALLQDYVAQQYRQKRLPKQPPPKQRSTTDEANHHHEPLTTSQDIPITFIATDDNSWDIRPRGTVRRMDYQTALEQYAGTDTTTDHNANNTQDTSVIVICSWMPMNEDWSATFRKYPTVREYILIGEADDGQCGDPWTTWGNPYFFVPHEDDAGEEDGNTTNEAIPSKPAYAKDGFVRNDLSFLLPYQFSRYDSFASKEGSTVSFRRRK